MTATFTRVNAVNAPKLMNEVDVATSRKIAPRPMMPARTMLNAGVWNRSMIKRETAPRERPVAAHRVEQPGDSGLSRQTRGELAEDQPSQKHRPEHTFRRWSWRCRWPVDRRSRTNRPATPA